MAENELMDKYKTTKFLSGIDVTSEKPLYLTCSPAQKLMLNPTQMGKKSSTEELALFQTFVWIKSGLFIQRKIKSLLQSTS